MWRRRSCGGSAARSGRAGSRTTSPGRCPAPRRSRPRDSPKALSSMSKMTGTTLTAPLAQVETPLLAVALAQGGAVPASLAEFDRAAGGIVARAMISGDFKGKRDETAVLYPGGAKPQRVLLLGLGKAGDVTRNGIRRAAAVAAKRARALDATHFAFAIAADARNGIAAGDLGQVVVEGAAQGAWAFTELKAAPDEPKAEVEAVAWRWGRAASRSRGSSCSSTAARERRRPQWHWSGRASPSTRAASRSSRLRTWKT